MAIGINIYDNDFNRLTISNGAVLVKSLNGLSCQKETYVPKTPWLKLEDSDKYAINKSNYLANVSIGILDQKLIKKIQKLKIDKCNSPRELHFIQESSKYNDCLKLLINHISKFNRDGNFMTQHRLYFSGMSLRNNTFNKQKNEYLGMHLDSYEGQLLESRHVTRNRICINLGLQSRYLLFYRTSIFEMAQKINNTTNNQNINDIYMRYMMLNSKEPIYRIEIKPFEYYIAPTESIIHDGSNWPSTSPDINLVFRGRFNYKKLSTFKILINKFLK